MKEKWTADFSKPEKSCFDIKPEISHNAYLDDGSLFLGLRKKNCMAWLETADRVYVDQVIEARLRFDSLGGYCAAGIMFRVVEEGTYYLALFSSKGYFRVDAVTKNSPSPLVGWTEAPGLDGNGASLGIIARGDHLIFLLNGRWIAEARDDSIPGGHLGFALVSYDEAAPAEEASAEEMYPPPGLLSPAAQESYVCRAWLDLLSVDSRPAVVGAEYNKWCGSAEISAESRLRLAESYAALDRFDAAYDQVLKAWRQREEAARSVMATYTEMRVRGELLFAARMASRLGQYEAAQEYIDICLAMGDGAAGDGASRDAASEAALDDELDALSQKAIILSAQGKHAELAGFLPGHIQRVSARGDVSSVAALYALLGHALWSLQDYKAAAAAWDKAFSLNAGNGLYAACAADAYEKLGKNAQALSLRLHAGNCFLRQQDNGELGTLVPKLLAVGGKSWEAHAFAGKWAYAAGDFDRAEAEMALSDELRRAEQSQQKKPAKTAAKAEPTKAKPSASGKAATKVAAAKAGSAKAAPAKAEPKQAAPAKAKKAPAREAGKTDGKKPAPSAKPKQAAPAAKKTTKKTPAKKTGSP